MRSPHACRCCYVSYDVRFQEYFGDFWSPWSICESRTHTTSTKEKCMKMHENQRSFRKSKSLTCPPNIPLQITQISAKIRRKHAVQSQCRADPRNWNREIYDLHRSHPKIHQSHRSWDAVWVRLSQIDQESPKYSRTHASCVNNWTDFFGGISAHVPVGRSTYNRNVYFWIFFTSFGEVKTRHI